MAWGYSDSTWNSLQIATGKKFCLTSAVKVNFSDEENDQPDVPNPYGIAGWTTEDASVLIYDRYDIWQFHPENKTGCRYIVVDSYNEAHPMNFYTKNGFDFFFKTEEEEATETGFSADTHLNTRLMYFDLIKLRDL